MNRAKKLLAWLLTLALLASGIPAGLAEAEATPSEALQEAQETQETQEIPESDPPEVDDTSEVETPANDIPEADTPENSIPEAENLGNDVPVLEIPEGGFPEVEPQENPAPDAPAAPEDFSNAYAAYSIAATVESDGCKDHADQEYLAVECPVEGQRPSKNNNGTHTVKYELVLPACSRTGERVVLKYITKIESCHFKNNVCEECGYA